MDTILGGITAAIVILASALAIVMISVLPRLFSGRSGNSNGSSPEDSRMIQEIYTGMRKWDARIEALETLVLEQSRSRTAKDRP